MYFAIQHKEVFVKMWRFRLGKLDSVNKVLSLIVTELLLDTLFKQFYNHEKKRPFTYQANYRST